MRTTKNKYSLLVCLVVLFLSISPLEAQTQQVTHQLAIDYILQHKELAVKEMHRTGIPASITLAQGMLESNFGRSRLAVLANNHFGAKCHNTWKGPGISHDDDAPGECFRKYHDVYQSYIDHSHILAKKRYQFLYNLSLYDYKSWAHGLKKAGYATDPYYAFKLIGYIERYSLYVYDRLPNTEEEKANYNFVFTQLEKKDMPDSIESSELALEVAPNPTRKIPLRFPPHLINTAERTPLVLQEPEKINGAKALTYTVDVMPVQISENYNIGLDDLLALNDMNNHEVIPAFTPIYISKRKKKADRKNRKHQVKYGERMHEIALAYGIKLEELYRLNRMNKGAEPEEGVVLALRKMIPYEPTLYNPEKFNEITEEVFVWTPPKKENFLKNIVQIIEDNTENENYGDAPLKQMLMAADEVNKPDNWANSFRNNRTVNTTNTSVPTIVSTPKAAEKPKYVYHTVKAGETLYRLSVNYNVSIEQLKKLNRLQSNTIYVGTRLRIF